MGRLTRSQQKRNGDKRTGCRVEGTKSGIQRGRVDSNDVARRLKKEPQEPLEYLHAQKMLIVQMIKEKRVLNGSAGLVTYDKRLVDSVSYVEMKKLDHQRFLKAKAQTDQRTWQIFEKRVLDQYVVDYPHLAPVRDTLILHKLKLIDEDSKKDVGTVDAEVIDLVSDTEDELPCASSHQNTIENSVISQDHEDAKDIIAEEGKKTEMNREEATPSSSVAMLTPPPSPPKGTNEEHGEINELIEDAPKAREEESALDEDKEEQVDPKAVQNTPEATRKDPNDPKNMEFQTLFYNPSTHSAAMTLLMNDLPGTSSVQFARDPQGEAIVKELINRFEAGKKQEIRNKRKKKMEGKSPLSKELPDSSSSDEEMEEALMDFQLLDNLTKNRGSDFQRLTVPQYELKKKLYAMHSERIKRMETSQIDTLCQQIIPELQDIIKGTLPSKRHDLFQVSGINHEKLRELTVCEPFTAAHNSSIIRRIQSNLVDDWDGTLLHYSVNVLIPEGLIRIFARANNISVDQAEKELRFEANYDGKLSEEIVRTIAE